jgi:hypothetical protein
MKVVYENWKNYYIENDFQAIKSARARASKRVSDILANPTRKSTETLRITTEVNNRMRKIA